MTDKTAFGLPVVVSAMSINPQFSCSYQAFSVLKKAELELETARRVISKLTEQRDHYRWEAARDIQMHNDWIRTDNHEIAAIEKDGTK